MTAQEQQMLQGLTDRVNQTQLAEKDSDAEQFLARTLGRNPDALYILSQTVLVQQYALDNAKQQLEQAKQQLEQAKQQLAHPPTAAEQPRHVTSFLGNLLHLTDGPSPSTPPPPPPQQLRPGYVPVQSYTQQSSYPQQPANVQPSIFGGGAQAPQSGSFLRSAMQTATGVAAGALAFEGIESLMHGFGGGGGGFGGGSGLGGFGGGGRPEEIVNNYYGDSGSPGRGDLADRLSPDADRLSPDIEDRRDDPSGGSAFADTADTNDVSSNDDVADDSLDDASNIDDGSDTGSDFDSGSSDDNSSF